MIGPSQVAVFEGMSFSVLFLGVPVIAVVLVILAVAAVSRRGSSRALPMIMGVILGLVLVVVAAASAVFFLRVRSFEAPDDSRPATAVVAEPSTEPHLQAWVPAPEGDDVPAWVGDERLLRPLTGYSEAAGRHYVRQNEAGRLAGFSGFATTRENAVKQAWQSVLERLQSLVAVGCAVERRENLDFKALGPRALEGMIDAEVRERRDEFEVDTYAGLVERDYGTVHRAAVLIQAPPTAIQDLAQSVVTKFEAASRRYLTVERRRLATWAYSIGGGLFLLLVILAVYLFLNTHTRGYYAWPLRLVALVIYVGAVGAFLVLLQRLALT